MKKRLLSTLLALCMVLSLLPGTVWAAEPDSGTCGDNLTWTLDADGMLTISGTGAMTDYNTYYDSANSAPWNGQRNAVTAVVIDSNVTTIGDNAFCSCSNLTSVSIPDSVTSIGDHAFSLCSSLTSVSIPDNVVSVGFWAFSQCDNLISATISGNIGEGAFWGCSSLSSVIILNNVTTIGYGAFEGCSSLVSMTIPNSVTSIDSFAFNGCSSLTSVIIPNSVTTIGEAAFQLCSSLTSVAIPNSVTTIGDGAFHSCSSLTSVIIPDSVTSIGMNMFNSCNSLASVSIPDSVTSIADFAFYVCSNLTSVTIPDSVTSIGVMAFDNCTSLTDVYYSGSKSQWEQIEVEYDNDPLLNANIHYGATDPNITPATIELPPAVKYVYYSVELPDSWRVDYSSLPEWLITDEFRHILFGMPMQAGAYPITLSDDHTEQTVTLTVRENADINVDTSISEGYEIIQDIPNTIVGGEDLIWIIDETEPPAPGEPDIFDRFLDLYVDGIKLKGGKLEDGEEIPDDWDYYARRGSVVLPLLGRYTDKIPDGKHTITATYIPKKYYNSPSYSPSSYKGPVETVSTNFSKYTGDLNGPYFPQYTGNSDSIVNALASMGIDWTYAYRKEIALVNGIYNYCGTADQNTHMLYLLKAGKLIYPGADVSGITPDDNSGKYYPRYTGNTTSIVNALKAVDVDWSYINRVEIAKANGIANYKGTAEQNAYLLDLLKVGRLLQA